MSIVIGRYPEGVVLNPMEYVLDEKGTPIEFRDVAEAKQFLRDFGHEEEDIDACEYIEKHGEGWGDLR